MGMLDLRFGKRLEYMQVEHELSLIRNSQKSFVSELKISYRATMCRNTGPQVVSELSTV